MLLKEEAPSSANQHIWLQIQLLMMSLFWRPKGSRPVVSSITNNCNFAYVWNGAKAPESEPIAKHWPLRDTRWELVSQTGQQVRWLLVQPLGMLYKIDMWRRTEVETKIEWYLGYLLEESNGIWMTGIKIYRTLFFSSNNSVAVLRTKIWRKPVDSDGKPEGIYSLYLNVAEAFGV